MSGTTAPNAVTVTSGDDAPATNMAENNHQTNSNTNDIETSIHVKITAPFARSFVWLLVFIGFILAAVAVRSCNFLEVNNTSDTTIQPVYFGFYRLQNPSTNVCVLYPSSSLPLSSAHKAAGAMGIVATITSGIVWLTMLSMVCYKAPSICWTICNVLLGISFLAESLQFIMFADPTCLSDEVQCRLGQGGAISVASMLFLLLSTILMCIMKPPSEPAFELDLSDVLKESSSEQNFLGIVISKQPKTTRGNDLETGRKNRDAAAAVTNNHRNAGSSSPLDLDGRTTAIMVKGSSGSSNKVGSTSSKRGGLSAGASAAMLSAKSLFGGGSKKQSSPSGGRQAPQSQSQSQPQPSLEQAQAGATSSNLNASSARAQSARGRGAFDLSNMLLTASDSNIDAGAAPATADTGIPHLSTNPTTSSDQQEQQQPPYPPAVAFVPDSVDF